jgi:uncharacterized protein YegJ (DUF2314 family)
MTRQPALRALIAALLIPVALAGSAAARPAIPNSERGNVYFTPVGDPAMAAAEREARRTLPIFLAKWRAKPAGYSAFRLKAGFRTDDGRGEEFLWLEPLSIAPDGAITGRLSDDAVAVSSLRQGVAVKAPSAKIGDWMYVKGGRIFGAFTTRAHLARATREERAQLLPILSPTPLEPGGR